MKVQFYLRFQTEFGDSLLISGNTDELGNDDLSKGLPMTYFNEEFWGVTIELKRKKINQLQYRYVFKTKDGEIIPEFGNDRTADLVKKGNSFAMKLEIIACYMESRRKRGSP